MSVRPPVFHSARSVSLTNKGDLQLYRDEHGRLDLTRWLRSLDERANAAVGASTSPPRWC